jgi:serine/threonine protein kinase
MTEQEIFERALDERLDERATFLDVACAGDAALRGRLEALLRSHAEATGFLDVPAVEQLASAAPGPAHAPADLSFLTPSNRPDSLGRLGHYEVLQVLGKGGFGIVLRAFDETLQRVVAVKVLAPQLAATSPARKRFLREAQSSARVRHENVVQVYAVEEQPLPYLVMEFIPGETLQQRCDRTGPLAVPEVLRIGRQIAEGLAAAHATGLIHRDVKPANVLIEPGPNEHVKLTDFGLARAADDASLSQSGIVAGTPMYMAPEQAQGDRLDHRADLFSLGSVLYVMSAGRPPFRAKTALAVLKRVAEDEPRPIREVIPEVPEWLCGIVARLHAKDPAARFQTAREVADLLADCQAKLAAQQETNTTLRTPAFKPSAPTAPRRRKLWVAAAALLLPLFALAVTEFAGVTDLFRRQQAAHDPIESGAEPPPAPVVKPLPPTFKNSIGMEFVIVPKGRSWLGGSEDKPGEREIKFQADFYLGRYEVTQEEWEKVMGENPSEFSRMGNGSDSVKDIRDEDLKRFPVEKVSWEQCQEFLAKLNKLQKETGWVYRLPKEAEWEYACRGGPMADRQDSAFDFYFAKPTNTLLPGKANFNAGVDRTCKVGSYEANRLGLHDMHGNVWEWCDDSEQAEDGASHRVTRGGCWTTHSKFCRAAMHLTALPTNRNVLRGLRVARVPSDTPTIKAK